MLKLSENKATELANMAIKTGFHLKRSFAVKLDLAKRIREDLGISCTGEEMLEHLTATKERSTSKKQAVEMQPTFTGTALAKERNREILQGDKFLITYAQNGTAVNLPFFNNLKAYADHIGARLLVVKGHYNTSAFSGQVKGDPDWYAEEIRPYLVDADQFLGYYQGIFLNAETNILPTATYPANAGGALIGNSEAIILGHTKQQAKTLPVMKGQRAKWVYTTGTCTVRNYVTSAAGAKAEADHAYGALLVKVCDESLQWQARQIRADELTGAFYDLNLFVENGMINISDKPFSMVLGDIHAEKLDPEFWGQTLDFIDRHKPQKVVLHDLHDFYSRNHHRRDSGHFLASMLGRTVDEDLQTTSRILTELRNVIDGGDIIVVQSNHDDALKRWLDCNNYDPSKDPINAVTYHKLNAAVYSDIINKEPARPILETALAELQLDSGMAVFLNLDQSCLVHGVEVGYHGHTGTNGSRGSPVQFAKMGVPMVTGHTHSPSMIGNVTTVGCMNLDQDYNVGMSSWDLCHAVIYPNGYTSLIKL